MGIFIWILDIGYPLLCQVHSKALSLSVLLRRLFNLVFFVMTDIDAMCNRTMNRLEHLWSPDSTNNQAFNRLTESLLGETRNENEFPVVH